jgi:membrane protein
MAALIQACNAAYDERESRGFIHRLMLSLVFTAGAIVYFSVTSAIAIGVPLVLDSWIESGAVALIGAALRWPLLWLFVLFGLAVIYRFAPARTPARWRWLTWGSAIAASLWVAGGIAFEAYVRTIGTFEQTYGTLGGVVVLLLWLYLSGFVVILGAEINSELEHQTRRDSTIGPEKPMGQRGAYVADTLGRIRPSGRMH